MPATQAVLSPGRAIRALAMLFLRAFVIGSSELPIVGVLNLIAGDLGVSVSAAGELVTGYALGLAIGGTILTALPASSAASSGYSGLSDSSSRG